MQPFRLVVLAAGVGSRLEPKVGAKPLVRVGWAFPIVGTEGYEGMIDAASVEHSPLGYLAAHLATRISFVTLTSGVEEVLPLVANSPVKALAAVDAGRVVGLLRVEEIEHLLTDRDRPLTRRAG